MRYDELEKISEDKGFYFKHQKEKDGRYYALLEQSTPLGEDWCLEFIYKNIADLVNQIIEYSYNYEVEDEAAIYIDIRGKHGVPNSIRALLDDSQWKKDKLTKFATQIQNAYKLNYKGE